MVMLGACCSITPSRVSPTRAGYAFLVYTKLRDCVGGVRAVAVT